MDTPKRKHGELSSTSDLDNSSYTTTPTENGSIVNKSKQKQTKAQKRKAARIDMKQAELNLDISVPPAGRVTDKRTETNTPTIEKQLEEINTKLSNVIASSDRNNLKQLIKETFLELKESLIGSLVKRIEIIEGELHEKVLENENMKKELKTMGEKLAKKEEETDRIEIMLEKERVRAAEQLNEQEQYSRRNNIRIMSLAGDEPSETSKDTADKVLSLFKEKLKISLTHRDIDIAHRLGKYKQGTKRQVIVKFVNRHEKAHIMACKKKLKGTKVSIFEDLTRLNNEVLASTRKKLPNEVDQSWSTEGKIFIKWKADAKVERIRFSEYQHWLELPWP